LLVLACARAVPLSVGYNAMNTSEGRLEEVLQDFSGATHCQSRNPAVALRVDVDPPSGGQRVLVVGFPPPSDDPAGRDVFCAVMQRDWSGGRAVTFQVKSAQAGRISVSFLDRNHVAYTWWADVPAEGWHTVDIPLDQVRPNPYFQPPGAKTGAPIDVSEVAGIGLAPQGKSGGQLMVGRIMLRK
jgi:hypothetical protein